MEKALIVIDMQTDFVTGVLGTKQARAIVPHIKKKIEQETAAGTRVIFTKDTHEDRYFDEQPPGAQAIKHAIRGTPGWTIIPELRDMGGLIIEKPTFGAFTLPKLCGDAKVIELCGLTTDMSVLTNALLLRTTFPDRAVVVDASLCAGVNEQSHNNALDIMRMCHIKVIEPQKKRLTVQTFGCFCAFIDGKPLKFPRSKSEELFAFLVDRRGAGVTNTQIADVLLEDKEYNTSVKNQVQTIISQMTKTLRQHGVGDVIVRSWNSLAIDVDKISCDYYDFLKEKDNNMMNYTGEYMSNYSWAEYTNGYLMLLQSQESAGI